MTFVSRDPGLLSFLDKIGEQHFGVPAPVRRQARPFGGLFDSFLNAFNEDDDDSEDDEGGASRGASSGAPPANPLASLLGGLMPPPQAQRRGPSRPSVQQAPARMETEDLD